MGGQGLCSVTADGNKNFNNHNSGRKTLTRQGVLVEISLLFLEITGHL